MIHIWLNTSSLLSLDASFRFMTSHLTWSTSCCTNFILILISDSVIFGRVIVCLWKWILCRVWLSRWKTDDEIKMVFNQECKKILLHFPFSHVFILLNSVMWFSFWIFTLSLSTYLRTWPSTNQLSRILGYPFFFISSCLLPGFFEIPSYVIFLEFRIFKPQLVVFSAQSVNHSLASAPEFRNINEMEGRRKNLYCYAHVSLL